MVDGKDYCTGMDRKEQKRETNHSVCQENVHGRVSNRSGRSSRTGDAGLPKRSPPRPSVITNPADQK